MAATIYTFLCEQGANFSEVVTWKNAGGAVIDNSGYSAQMQVRLEPNSSPIADLTTQNNKIELSGADGQIQLMLEAAETAAITPGDYFYDLEMVSPSGDVSRIAQGIFSVSQQITRT